MPRRLVCNPCSRQAAARTPLRGSPGPARRAGRSLRPRGSAAQAACAHPWRARYIPPTVRRPSLC